MPRLRRSDSNGKGLRRISAGSGFSYRDDHGTAVSAGDRERIELLAIPPAWTDVWISPHENGHILATGVDAAGRTQYVYHPFWRQQKDRLKFDRALELAASLPAARRKVTTNLRDTAPSKARALAAAFRLLDTGSLRVGSERYAQEHGSHGLSTLICSHASISGDTVSLAFPGKSGQDWESVLVDAELAGVLRGLKRRGRQARLLAWKDGRSWHPLSAEEINAYVAERTGGQFTAKDFRTLHGTVTAAVGLASAGPQSTPTSRKRVVARVMRDVADVLGNTPAVAKASYVDPRIVDKFDRGSTIRADSGASPESRLRELLGT
ncbi:DNA topoisomerase IB [Salinibacterium sp.]|uniref:DNA topoisomerase IB n=1 Tax=Salinibacterium sp. TaxID=1915057 RepID=UPI00286AF37C|nr:DNA topoisomerase IB [Salinibacterium sp.]